jgi:hypothetical protein
MQSPVIRQCSVIRLRRSGDLLVESLIEGPLHTLETIGDGTSIRIWGGFRTQVSPPPHFIEERLTWDPPDQSVTDAVLDQLTALDVNFGPCHTEFILTDRGPRIVEVNDRLIGDHCDFALADLLGENVFADALRVFLGELAPVAPPRPVRSPRVGHVHSILADADGRLTSAPPEMTEIHGQTTLSYRPMPATGSPNRVTGTNRDYLRPSST